MGSFLPFLQMWPVEGEEGEFYHITVFYQVLGSKTCYCLQWESHLFCFYPEWKHCHLSVFILFLKRISCIPKYCSKTGIPCFPTFIILGIVFIGIHRCVQIFIWNTLVFWCVYPDKGWSQHDSPLCIFLRHFILVSILHPYQHCSAASDPSTMFELYSIAILVFSSMIPANSEYQTPFCT